MVLARLGFVFLFAVGACAASASLNVEQQATCAQRAAWAPEHLQACARCRTSAVEAKCDCTDVAEKYKSQCRVQAARVQSADICADEVRVALSGCLARCQGECACEAACSAGLSARCGQAQLDLDRCLVETCDEVCR